MSFVKLPKNSKQILDLVMNAENPVQALCGIFDNATQKETEELRGILRELREFGLINIGWASNRPYRVTINNSARTYNEQLTDYEAKESLLVTEGPRVDAMIFISHRTTDKPIADMLADFFISTGIPRETIFCSSLPGNDVNERISGEVKAALRNSTVNIAILSRDYYQSAYCLNEAGVFWYQDGVQVIPIVLPEINANNMYGFLNGDYKHRRIDIGTDVSYIYDAVRAAVSAQQAKTEIIISEIQKLKGRYADFLKSRIVPETPTVSRSIDISDITTDDEKIVLYYILKKNVRRISKDDVNTWLHENEVHDVNIDNAFDLLSSFDGGSISGNILELGVNTFRQYSANASSVFHDLQICLNQHIKRSADTFNALWISKALDPNTMMFFAYIIDERMFTFGDRWMAEKQIESIKQWESKNSLNPTLSNNYGSCLEFIKQYNLVYESSWTSNGNPRAYTLHRSLRDLLINHVDEYLGALEKCKQANVFELPF